MIRNFILGDNALQILETGNKYGTMSTSEAFYPESFTQDMRWSDFLKRRSIVGKIHGFDGRKMFMADQEHKKGSWFEITKEYVNAHPEGWTDIPEDILIVTDKIPGVVIGHPVADCPVVMAYDVKNKAVAIGHCSAALIDKKMPKLVIDALEEAHASKDEDIHVYVSACAGKEWTYDKYPNWATDSNVWDDAITLGDDGLYHIDLKKAVLKQLKERNISNIDLSDVDTIKDPDYYSNSAAKDDPSKQGRNFAGVFFH